MTGYQLTDADKTLIRAMNKTTMGWNRFGRNVSLRIESNIAALHFDGQVLVDLVVARRETEKLVNRP